MKQWYYAKNGEKFGPFQRSHVLELYRQGKIAANDLVWEEGTPEWISALNAFGPLIEPPLATTSDAGEFLPFKYAKQGWNLIWRYPGQLIGGAFLVGLVSSFIVAPYVIGSVFLTMSMEQGNGKIPLLAAAIIYAFGLLLNSCLQPFISVGLSWMFLRAARGDEPEFNDLLIAFGRHWPKFLCCGLIIGLGSALVFDSVSLATAHNNHALNSIWVLVTIIISAFINVLYSFALLRLIERECSTAAAIKESASVVFGNLSKVVLLLLACAAINILGALACLLGLIFSIPITLAVMVLAYQYFFTNKE